MLREGIRAATRVQMKEDFANRVETKVGDRQKLFRRIFVILRVVVAVNIAFRFFKERIGEYLLQRFHDSGYISSIISIEDLTLAFSVWRK